jgi:hypothetical protein
MARFSKRSLRLLGDEFAGSWTLATITDPFEDAGVQAATRSPPKPQRPTTRLAAQYLSTLNLNSPGDTGQLVEMFNHVLFEMTH